MRVLMLLLATRAASAWAPRVAKQQWRAPPTDTAYPKPDTFPSQRSDDCSDVNSSWEGNFPPTLGDIDDSLGFSLEPSKQTIPPRTRLRSPLRLMPTPKLQPQQPPPSAPSSTSPNKARISYTDAGTLVLEWPATGWNADAVVTGAFSVAWFGALFTPGFTLAAAPVLLPFYVAGGLVAKRAFVEPFTSTTVSIGEFGWSLERSTYGKAFRQERCGATRDLQGATVVDKSAVVEGEMRYRYELQLLLTNESRPITIESSFKNPDEPTRLATTINQQLQQVRSTKDDEYESLFLHTQ